MLTAMQPTPSVRHTKALEAVTSVFLATATPLSLAQVYSQAQRLRAGIAYSTVFRIIGRLEQEGKVVRIDWRERGSYYEWADLPHHHHIVCQCCGKVIDLDCEQFNFQEADIERVTGFVVKRHSIEFEGICQECLRQIH